MPRRSGSFYGLPIVPSSSQWQFCRKNLGENSTSKQTIRFLAITMVKLVLFVNIHRVPRALTTKRRSTLMQKDADPKRNADLGGRHFATYPMEAQTMCGTAATIQPLIPPWYATKRASMPIKFPNGPAVLQPHFF
jgi:hypothetical protein